MTESCLSMLEYRFRYFILNVVYEFQQSSFITVQFSAQFRKNVVHFVDPGYNLL